MLLCRVTRAEGTVGIQTYCSVLMVNAEYSSHYWTLLHELKYDNYLILCYEVIKEAAKWIENTLHIAQINVVGMKYNY